MYSKGLQEAVYQSELTKLREERDAFQTQAGALKREVFALKSINEKLMASIEHIRNTKNSVRERERK